LDFAPGEADLANDLVLAIDEVVSLEATIAAVVPGNNFVKL
jgi:hypothetical protein